MVVVASSFRESTLNRPLLHYGHDRGRWDAARAEARRLLVHCARNRQTISYSELAASISAIRFSPRARAFHVLLEEICSAEDAARGVMLASLVVHKGGDGMPGDGYFAHAAHLGRDTEARRSFWESEVTAVFDAFAGEA